MTTKIIPLQTLFPELKMYRNNTTNPKGPRKETLWERMKWFYQIMKSRFLAWAYNVR